MGLGLKSSAEEPRSAGYSTRGSPSSWSRWVGFSDDVIGFGMYGGEWV